MLSNDVGLSHESAQPVMNSDGPQERKRRRGRKRGERWWKRRGGRSRGEEKKRREVRKLRLDRKREENTGRKNRDGER